MIKIIFCFVSNNSAIGRKVKIVNLDPANDPGSNYQCAIDVNDLITVEETMTTFSLGPNGALVYCMQYLQRNADWLEARLDELAVDDYVLFDCPGQVRKMYTFMLEYMLYIHTI